ncbi:hypothetical protein BKA67DRAFT_307761 [Truncatella angustata]|uniref:Uncharacterized protein n=1 Tax=Truncatella angustata TaxID=152316 RepID=A0A9P8UIW7_9PEZI|nr:uncharacterized protein BKA67DRAFT_307761 [Truncatella angustata]KAH6653022.1 hypothetical protein BKA67DRAFT_307761 [Truncatella angustata]
MGRPPRLRSLRPSRRIFKVGPSLSRALASRESAARWRLRWREVRACANHHNITLLPQGQARKVDIKTINKAIKTSFVQVDLSDHASVRQAGSEILAEAPKVDVLIDSMGNMAIYDYTVDKQGIEIQLSVDHLGQFLLTNLLGPALLQMPELGHTLST